MNELKSRILEYLEEHYIAEVNTIAKALKECHTDVKDAVAILEYEGKVKVPSIEMVGNFEVIGVKKRKKRISAL
jgi:hypothetical protein